MLKAAASSEATSNENGGRQQKRALLKCPRCESTNTKFCYYNNYSKLQPRHFCRACKRYWTEGGTLRNVPVGGSRRNKRTKTEHHCRIEDDDDTNKQQQVAAAHATLNRGEIDTVIFPDIFRQIMFQPQLPLLPPLPPEIGGAENFYSGCSSSNSSSSLNLDDYVNGAWLHDSVLAQHASYWNCWDGMLEFDASDITQLSAPNESQ